MNALVWVNFDDFGNGAGKRALGDFRVIASDQGRALLENPGRITAHK